MSPIGSQVATKKLVLDGHLHETFSVVSQRGLLSPCTGKCLAQSEIFVLLIYLHRRVYISTEWVSPIWFIVYGTVIFALLES